MSGSVGMRVRAAAALVGAAFVLAPLPGVAKPSLDLSKYNCTRPSDFKTVRGSRLAAQGYRVANRARFGDLNLTMIKRGKIGLANCLLRSEARN